MRKPGFITFTGYDDGTDIDRMIALSEKYPIEWAVLFSPTKRANRYPSVEAVERLRGALKPRGLRGWPRTCAAPTRRRCRLGLTALLISLDSAGCKSTQRSI